MTYRNRELLDLAHSLGCMAEIPGICENGSAEPSHSNQQRDGKGMGNKAADPFFAAICRKCHSAIDHGHPSLDGEHRLWHWERAFRRTLLALWEHGLVKVAAPSSLDRGRMKPKAKVRSVNTLKKPKVSKGSASSPDKIIPRNGTMT